MGSANDLIGTVCSLKRRPNAEQALQTLQRVAAQVRPLMRQRGWRVGVLREFYPKTVNLLGLNVNRGAEIRLRLRSAHSEAQFLAYGDVLGTMLHELVHIERGPHDAVFYGLLDTLRAEAEALLVRGYAGDGFYSAGQRVGVGCSHNAPRHQLRDKAARAAEQRQHRASLGGPPRTLAGGSGGLAAQQAHRSPAQMAALALERRLHDETWCGQTMAGDDVLASVAAGSGSPIIIDSDSDSDGDVVAAAPPAEVESAAGTAATTEKPSGPPAEVEAELAVPEAEQSEPEPELEGLGPEPTDEDMANVAGVFGRLSVAEVRRYDKSLQQHIEVLRRRMRRVAGQHYPELIDAADVAAAMRLSAATVGTQLEQLRGMLQRVQSGRGVRQAGDPAGSDRGAAAEQDEGKARMYAVAAQVKVLVDTPEVIWKALAAQQYLRAALLFLIAHEINERLCEQSRVVAAVDPLVAFPVVGRQWSTVAPFREQIAAKAHQLLSTADVVPIETGVSAICAAALLEDADAEVACTAFLACRGQTLQPLLERLDAMRDGHDAADRLAAAVLEPLGRVRQIVTDYVAIFGSPGEGGRRHASRILTMLASICADVDLPSAPPPTATGGNSTATPRHSATASRARRRKSSVAGRVLSAALPASPLADGFALDSLCSPPASGVHGGALGLSSSSRRPLHEPAQTGSGGGGMFMVARYLPPEIAQFRPRVPRILDAGLLEPDSDALSEADEDSVSGLARWLDRPDELPRVLAGRVQPVLERVAAHALGLWWGAAVDGIREAAEQAIGRCVQTVADAAHVCAVVRAWEQHDAPAAALPWPTVAAAGMIQSAAGGGQAFEAAIEPVLRQRARALQRQAVERALELPDAFVADGDVVDVLAGHLPWRPLPRDGSSAVADLQRDVRAGMDVVPPAVRALGDAVGSALLDLWRDGEAWWQQMSGAAVAPEAAACAAHLAERWAAAADRLEQWATHATEQAHDAVAADERAALGDGAEPADMPLSVALCIKGAWAARTLADVPRQIAAAGTPLMRSCWAQQPASATDSATVQQLAAMTQGLLAPWLAHLGSSAALAWADRLEHLYFRIPHALHSDVPATRHDVVRAWMASSAADAPWSARYAALRRIAAAPAAAAIPAAAPAERTSASIRALTAQLAMRQQAVCGLSALCGCRADAQSCIRAAFLRTAEAAVADRLERRRQRALPGDTADASWDGAQLAADLAFVLRQLGAPEPALTAASHGSHPSLAAAIAGT
ncbi:hypothetical protein H4R19_002189 [Coemansia spiralis]|nr:hypothetical protein H4R19_002189 [Coemansia spiralis]